MGSDSEENVYLDGFLEYKLQRLADMRSQLLKEEQTPTKAPPLPLISDQRRGSWIDLTRDEHTATLLDTRIGELELHEKVKICDQVKKTLKWNEGKAGAEEHSRQLSFYQPSSSSSSSSSSWSSSFLSNGVLSRRNQESPDKRKRRSLCLEALERRILANNKKQKFS